RGHRPAAQGHPVPVRRGRGTGRGAGRRPAHGAGGPAAGLPGAAPWRRRARPYPGHQLHRDRPAAVAMRTARRATASGVLAILLWSSLALLTVATAGLPPFQVLATAFAVAAASGLLQAAWRGRAGLAGLHAPPAALALSTAGLFGYHALYFMALKRAPAVEANLLNYLWPLLIVVFAGLLPGARVRPA